MRQETASQAQEKLKGEKERYEQEIVALYRRRLAEVGMLTASSRHSSTCHWIGEAFIGLTLPLFLPHRPSLFFYWIGWHAYIHLQEVAKREAAMEDRLQAQDSEYRRQCEELRLRMQSLLRERQEHLKEKVGKQVSARAIPSFIYS